MSDMEGYKKMLKKDVNDIFKELECVSSSFRMLTLLRTAEFLKGVEQLNLFISILESFLACDRKVKEILLKPVREEEETAMEERGFFDLLFSSFLKICTPSRALNRSEDSVAEGRKGKITEERGTTPSKNSAVSLVLTFMNALSEDLNEVFLTKLIPDWLDSLSEFSIEETYLLISKLCWKIHPDATSFSTESLRETTLAVPVLQSLVKVFQLKRRSCLENEEQDWFWLSQLLEKLTSAFEKFPSHCAIDMSISTETLKNTRLLYGQIFKSLRPDAFRSAVDSLHGYIRQNTEKANEIKLKMNLDLLRLLLLESHDRRGAVNIRILCSILERGVSSCFSSVADLIESEVRSCSELFSHLFIFVSELLINRDSELPSGIVEFLSKIVRCCSESRPIKCLALQNSSELMKLSSSLLHILDHRKTDEDLACLVLRQIVSISASSKTVPDVLRSEEAVEIYFRYAPLQLCRLWCTTCLAYCLSDGRQSRQADFSTAYGRKLFDLDTFISCSVNQALSAQIFRLCCELELPDGVCVGQMFVDKLLLRLGDDSKLIFPKLQAVLGLIEEEEISHGQAEVRVSISWRLRSWLKQRCDVLLTFVRDNIKEPPKTAAAALDLVSVVLKLSRDERKRLVRTVLPKVDYFKMKRLRDRKMQKATAFWQLFSVDVSEDTSRTFETLNKEDFEEAVRSLEEIRNKLGPSPKSVELETKLPKGVSHFANNKRISVFGETFDLVSAPEGFEDHVPQQSLRLVWVSSTKRNILRVLKSQQTLHPILLEGDTGVGKSAAVTEAARLLGRPIIRFNMSRSVTCSDIVGHVSLCAKSGQLVHFEPGPFTTAFENGIWLLLDELNLASDEVLQCIELALDTGCLVVDDYSSDRGRIEIRKHENFLLFATQNPNAGDFKGMREALSETFVSRFQTLSLEPPAREELIDILAKTFKNQVSVGKGQKDIIKSWAKRMVDCHERIKQEAMSPQFLPEGPNAIFTVRELLKWVSGVISAVSGEERRFSIANSQTDKFKVNEVFAVEAFCVYETRFSSSLCRQAVHKRVMEHFPHEKPEESGLFALQFIPQCTFEMHPCLKISFSDYYEAVEFCHYEEMIRFHCLLSSQLLSSYNCVFLPFLVPEWAEMGCESLDEVATVGYELYAKHMPVSLHERLSNLMKAQFDKKLKFPNVQHPQYTNFVVTPYIMKLWFYILHAVKHSQPVLLVGAPGSGKSEIILQLASVVGRQTNSWCITPETESSDLVGKIVPKEPAEWSDGIVTRSIRKGQWVLLDNLLDADSTVLERLNPLLEKDPSWVLTENGKTSNLFLDDSSESFRFFSTATVSELDKGLGKMSPAFANRLTIIHVDDCAFSEVGLTSLATLAWNLYNSDPENSKSDTSEECRAVQVTSTFLLNVKREFPVSQGGPLITMRTLVRVIGGAKRVLCDLADFHVTDALYTCCQLSIFQQLGRSAEDRLDPLFEDLIKNFQKLKGSSPPSFIDFLSEYNNDNDDSSFILDPEFTPTRYRYGNVVLFGILVKLPVLLEGPPATGKTSLVESIRRRWSHKGCLHRVINSDSTSVQDYLGTYVPCGDGKFKRLNGPLRRAMEDGGYFLSDEFNLADPSVLNMLLPLLEGRRLIYDPVSGTAIRAHREFRFFATQNNATYADRKPLSVGLRSRFLEAQVKDFAKGELAYILQNRKYSSSKGGPTLGDSLAKKLEKACIKINEAVQERRLHLGSGNASVLLTLREMIKWIERFVLLSDVSENRKLENLLGRAGLSLLVPRLRPSSTLSNLQSVEKLKEILMSCGLLQSFSNKALSSVVKEASGCLISDGFAKNRIRNNDIFKNLSSRLIPKDYKLTFARIHMAVEAKEPVLLVGPTTFKTTIVEDYFRTRNLEFAVVQLSSDTQVSDLLGQMHPFSFDAAMHELLQTALQLYHCLRKRSLSSASSIRQIIEECRRSFDEWREDEMDKEREEAYEEQLHASPQLSNDEADDDSEFDDEASEQKSVGGDSRSSEHFLSTDEDGNDEEESTGYSDEDVSFQDAVLTQITAVDPTSQFLTEDSEDNDDGSSSTESNTNAVPHPEAAGLVLTVEAEKFLFKACFKKLREAVSALKETSATVGFLIIEFLSIFDMLEKSASDTGKPVFLFKDGPVALALKEEKSLFFEDVDLPSQAVIERLNSLLEPSRTLFLSEDVTVGVQVDVALAGQVMPGLQMLGSSAILATVHTEGCDGVNLSPALRSRFSEVILSSTDIPDILAVTEKRLENSSLPKTRRRELIDVVENLAEGLQKESKLFSLKTVTNLLTIVESLYSSQVDSSSEQHGNVNLLDLVAVASKIILVDQCDKDRKAAIDLLLGSLKVGVEESGTLSKEIVSWLCEGAEGLSEGKDIWEPLDFLEPMQQSICHRTLPVAAKVSENVQTPVTDEHIKENFTFTATPTCIDNFVRVVVCLSSNLPLLLQGPPGIGKTAVVQQCGDLFGYTVERINFTKDTSLENLIGSYVPTWSGAKLVFQWRAGKALTALENGHFLLLDEINLASQEVLDEIKTMINPMLKSYFVKGLGKPVQKHSDFRLFATMNPESVGGGRTNLPRSIENAFLKIILQDYNRREESQICIHQFSVKNLVPGLLQKEDIDALLSFHFLVKNMINRREIGRRGGPYELNVRDLLKVGDVLAANMKTQLYHMEISETYAYERNDAHVKSIRTAASMVYCRLFHGREDQLKVQQRINQFFPLLQQESDMAASKISIDSNLPNVTRIGSVYLAKGQTDSAFLPLVHTNQLKEQLQLLGCAVSSGRAVVLEGGTCSRKTSLIYELARQCKRKLHVFSLNTETETDMLIGRWVPFKPISALQNLVHESLAEFEKMLCFILNNFLQSGDQSFLKDIILFLAKSVEKAWSNQDEKDVSQQMIIEAEKVADALNDIVQLSDMLEEQLLIQKTGQLRRKILRKYIRYLSTLSRSLVEKVTAFRSKMTAFEYVESALVAAIRRGEWVVLDNISAAPSDVVERLMSLIEAVPTLRVYESPESPLLSRENGGMDSNFCLFATVNSSRQSQGKLSSAFYNRVIRMWLPEVDEEAVAKSAVSNDLRETELSILVLGILGDLPGAHILAKVIVSVHCRLKRLSLNRQLLTVGGCSFTFRTALRAARELSRRLRSRKHLAHFNEVLQNCYVKCCVGKDQAKALDEVLEVFREASCDPSFEFTRRNLMPSSSNADKFEEEALTIKELAKMSLVGSILVFLGTLNFQIKKAGTRDVTKAAAFCQESMMQLIPHLGSERDLLDNVDSVQDACASAELDNSRKKLMDVSKRMEVLIAAIQMFTQGSGDMAVAECLEKYANRISSELFDFGAKVRRFLCQSSFNCLQQRLEYVTEILVQFQVVRGGISTESWLTEFTFVQKSKNAPDAMKIDSALSALQDGLLLLAQQATLFHEMTFYANKVSSLNSELEAAVNEHALESDKPFLLSFFHQIMQQQIVATSERKRLLQFIVEKAVLPPQLLVKLEIFLSATQILFEAEMKIPFALRQIDDGFYGRDEKVGTLHNVSIYDSAIAACKCLKDAMKRFSSSLAPSIRRIDAARKSENEEGKDSAKEAKITAERERLRQELILSKKQLFIGTSGESIRRVQQLYAESALSIHRRIFIAVANLLKKQKDLMPLRNASMPPQVRNLIRQMPATEIDAPFGSVWLAAFFCQTKNIFLSSEGIWEPFLVSNVSEMSDAFERSRCSRKVFFVSEMGFAENQTFSFCVVALNEAKKKAFFIKAAEDDDFGSEFIYEEGPFVSYKEGQADVSNSLTRFSLCNELEKFIRSNVAQKMKIERISVFCESDREIRRLTNYQVLLLTASLGSVISGSPKNMFKVQKKVLLELSESVKSTAKILKPYCHPSDRQKCLEETVDAIHCFLVLHESVEFGQNWEEERERESRRVQIMIERFSESYRRSQELAVPRSIRQRHQLLSRIGRTLDRRLTEVNSSNDDDLPWDVRLLLKLEKKIHDVGSVLETKRLSAADKFVRLVRKILYCSVRLVCDLTEDCSPCWVSEAHGQVSFEKCFSLPQSNDGFPKLLSALRDMKESCTKVFSSFRVHRDTVEISHEKLIFEAARLESDLETMLCLMPTFCEAIDFASVSAAATVCAGEFKPAHAKLTTGTKERQREAQERKISEFVDDLCTFHREAISFASPPLQFLLRLKRSIHEVKLLSHDLGPGSADILGALEGKRKAFSEELKSLRKRERTARHDAFSFEADVKQACPDIEMEPRQRITNSTNRGLIDELAKQKTGKMFQNVKMMTELLNVVAGYSIERSRRACVLRKLSNVKKGLRLAESSKLMSVTAEDRIALAELVAVTGIGDRAEAYSSLSDSLFDRELNLQNLNVFLEKLCAVYFANRRPIIFSKQWRHLCAYSAITYLCESVPKVVKESERTVSNAAVLYCRTRERCKALEKFMQHLTKNDATSIRPLFLGVSDMYCLLFPDCTRFLCKLNNVEESLADFEGDWQEDDFEGNFEEDSLLLGGTAEESKTFGLYTLLAERGHKADTFFFHFSGFIRELSSDLKGHITNQAATFCTYLSRESFPEIQVCTAVYGLFLCEWLCNYMSLGLSSLSGKGKSFHRLICGLAASSKTEEKNKSRNKFLASTDAQNRVRTFLFEAFEISSVCGPVDNFWKELGASFDFSNFQDRQSLAESAAPVSESKVLEIRNLFKSLLSFTSGEADNRASARLVAESWERLLVEKCSTASENLTRSIENFQSTFSQTEWLEAVLAPLKLLNVCWTSLRGALTDVSRKASVFLTEFDLEPIFSKTRLKGNRLEEVTQSLVTACGKACKEYEEIEANVLKLLSLSQEFSLYAEEVCSWATASFLLHRASEVSTNIAALTFLYVERRDKGNSYLKAIERKIVQHDSTVLENYSRLNVESCLAHNRGELACLVRQLKNPFEAFVFCHSGNPYSLLEKEIDVSKKLMVFWGLLGEACTNLVSKLEWVCREVHLENEGAGLVKEVLVDLGKLLSQGIKDNISSVASFSDRLLLSTTQFSNFISSQKYTEPAEKLRVTVRFISLKVIDAGISLVKERLRKAVCRPAPVDIIAQDLELAHTLQLNLLSDYSLRDLAAFLENEEKQSFLSLRLLSSFLYEGCQTLGDAIQNMLSDFPWFRLDVHFVEDILKKFDLYCNMCISLLKRNLCSEVRRWNAEVGFEEANSLFKAFAKGPIGVFERGLMAYYGHCQSSSFGPTLPDEFEKYRSCIGKLKELTDDAIQRWTCAINDEIEAQSAVCEIKEKNYFMKFLDLFKKAKTLYDEALAKYTKAKKEHDESREAIQLHLVQAVHFYASLVKLQGPDHELLGSLISLIQKFNGLLLVAKCRIDDLFCIKEDGISFEFSELTLLPASTNPILPSYSQVEFRAVESGKKKVSIPVFLRKPFSLSEKAVKTLTLFVDDFSYKVQQSTLLAMCTTPVAAEKFVVDFRLPKSGRTIAITFDCASNFNLSVHDSFKPLLDNAESLREGIRNFLEDAKSLMEKRKWKPIPLRPIPPKEETAECQDKVTFCREKKSLTSWSRDVESKTLDFFSQAIETFQKCSECVGDTTGPPLAAVSYSEFKRCREASRTMSLSDCLTNIKIGQKFITALRCSAPKGTFLFKDGNLPSAGVPAEKDLVKAASFVQCFSMYTFHRSQSKQLSLLLLCSLTASSNRELEECYDLLRSSSEALERSKALSANQDSLLQHLHDDFTSLQQFLLTLSRQFCDLKRKSAGMTQTFASAKEDFDFLSFDHKETLLRSVVPTLHLLDDKDSVLAPSLKHFVIIMRCSNAHPESMLVRFCIFNESVAVCAKYRFESADAADEGFDGFEMIPRSGTINPLSKVEIAVAFSEKVSSSRRRALVRSYCLIFGPNRKDLEMMERRVEFSVEGTLESVNDCISVSPKVIDFGVIDIGDRSSYVERQITITNTSSTLIKFRIIPGTSEEYCPSITCLVKRGENAMEAHKFEHDLPSASSFDLTFALELGILKKPKRFSQQFVIKFSSEKEICVCAQGQVVHPVVVGYDDDTGSKLEDSDILYVSKTADKALTFYNRFTVPCHLSLNLDSAQGHYSDFNLEPAPTRFFILPRTSQRVFLSCKRRESYSPSVLNVKDGRHAKHYMHGNRVAADYLPAETDPVYDCEIKFVSGKSENVLIPRVALSLTLDGRHFPVKEEVEVYSDTLEVGEHQVVKLNPNEKKIVQLHWTAGSFLEKPEKPDIVICRRVKSGRDILVPIQVNFKNQVTNVGLMFISNPKYTCAVVDAKCNIVQTRFRVKIGCEALADVAFTSVGAESFEICKGQVKRRRVFSFSVKGEEEMQLQCSLKSDAEWYGLSIRVGLKNKFVGFNGKAFLAWRKLYMVGKSSTSELQEIRPLSSKLQQAQEIMPLASDVQNVRRHLAEAISEDSSRDVIRHLIDAFCQLLHKTERKFRLAATLPQFLKFLESLEQNSMAKSIILSLLKYSQNSQEAEFGVLLAIKEKRGSDFSIGWLAEALIFPKTQNLSPSRWILTCSIQLLDYVKSSVVANKSVRESLQNFVQLLKKFDDVSHRLPQEPTKRSSLLALSEVAVKESIEESCIGALAAKLYGCVCQNATDFLKWLSEFSSLPLSSRNRSCSVGLLRCSVKLACSPLKACDIAFYIAEAVEFVSSRSNIAIGNSASLVLQRIGDALSQNPLTFPSIDTLFKLFCNVIQCLTDSNYLNKVERILMLVPLALKSSDVKETYATIGKIFAALVNSAFSGHQAVETVSGFLHHLEKSDVRSQIESYSNVLVSWFTLRSKNILADAISKVTAEALYHSCYCLEWKSFFVEFDSKTASSVSGKCRELCRVFQTDQPLFKSMDLLREIGEILLKNESESFAILCKSLKELAQDSIGFQPCVAAFEALAALVSKSNFNQFHAAVSGVAAKMRLLNRAMSFEDPSQPHCSIRQTIAFESFQLASAIIYCQSLGGEVDKTSFSSIRGLLNRAVLSDELSKAMKATLLDLPAALMNVAVLFLPDEIISMCEPYTRRAIQLLENQLNLEQLLTKIVISVDKARDENVKRFLFDGIKIFKQVVTETKNVSELLRFAGSLSKNFDAVTIRESFDEIDYYDFTTSGYLSFIANSSVFDNTSFLADSKNAAKHLNQASNNVLSLLPPRWPVKFAPFISEFVSILLQTSESDNLCLKAVAFIFDQIALFTTKPSCKTQSFDVSFSITKSLLSIGNLSIPNKQWDFAESVLSVFREASSLDISLISDLCSRTSNQTEKEFLLQLQSSYETINVGGSERSWEHFNCFLRKFAKMSGVTLPVSNVLSSVVEVCSAVFMEEVDIQKKSFEVLDAVIKCAAEVECSSEDQLLLSDIRKYFFLLCESHWQLRTCEETQQVVQRLFEEEEFDIERSIEAVTDLADSLGLIKNAKRQKDYNVLFCKLYRLSQSSECGSGEVISLCRTVVSLAVNVETTSFIEPSDVALLLEFLHRCWKLSKDEKSFDSNWESYVMYSIGAILTLLNSPMSRKKEIREDDCRSSAAMQAVVTTQRYLKWSSSEDEEFCLNLPKPTYRRCLSTESEVSSKSTSKSIEDLSECESSDESDSDDQAENSFLVRILCVLSLLSLYNNVFLCR